MISSYKILWRENEKNSLVHTQPKMFRFHKPIGGNFFSSLRLVVA